MGIKELKNEYSIYQKKYSLPSFKELNENFEIEKLTKETDCFLRTIRKIIMEKIVNFIGFLEMLQNPINAPRIYYGFINIMSNDEKTSIEKIYKSLGSLNFIALSLELGYYEKKEAELIIKINNIWNSNKKNLENIFEKMRSSPEVKKEKKERNYYG